MSRTETSLLVTLAGHEHEWARVVIEFRHIKAYTPRTPLGEFQPLEPPEPADVELLSVRVIDGDNRHDMPYWITAAFEDAIREACFEAVEAEADAEADARYDAMRDEADYDRDR